MEVLVDEAAAGIARIAVAGEIDVSCADELREAIDEQLAAEPTQLEVDFSKVSYIDSTGIGVLVGAARHCAESDIAFAVVNPQRMVARVLRMLELDEELGVREDAE